VTTGGQPGGLPLDDGETVRAAPVPLSGFELQVVTPEGVRQVPLPPSGRLVLGRAADAGIRIDDPSVSRAHARLHVGPELRIEDLGSANGTWVGGTRLSSDAPVLLPVGAAARLGEVTLVVLGPPASRPAVPPRGALVVDAAMRSVHELLERVAPGSLPVLLLGETGVGKEVLARRVHEVSGRPGPFVAVNCAALAPTLLESELFGHERGAFTGADAARVGLVESAHQGTLFLDEVGELPLGAQAKLLRVLEEHAVLRVGATRPRAVDLRVVSATHRALQAETEAGRFRSDLLFRLDGVCLSIPPLRARRSEILPLAERFLAELAREGAPLRLSRAAAAALEAAPWPGNVRQLRHAVERAALVAGAGPIEPAHLPESVRAAEPPPRPGVEPAGGEVEDEAWLARRAELLAVLEACQGNQTRAAEQLGVSRRTMVSWMVRYRIPRPQRRLPGSAAAAPAPPPDDADERSRVLHALDACAGNQTRAAALLGLSRAAFVERLEAFGIPRPRRG
jgi:two-component system response regulator AtoC